MIQQLKIQELIDELKLNSAVVESSKDQSEEASSGSKLYADPNEWDVKKEHGFLRWLIQQTTNNKLILLIDSHNLH